MQTFFHYNLLRWNIQYTNFRRKDQHIIIRDIIPRWTQAISVKHGSHAVTITEQDRRRTIPWFHHSCIILIEIFLFLGKVSVICPRFRNCDHNCQWKIHTTHNHEFNCIIQHCRIRTATVDCRKHFMKFSFHTLGFHIFFSGTHLIRIAADRVDLAIMHNKTVRMRSLPAWIRVRTESGVNQCDCGIIIRILQIREEQSELIYQKHSFISDGTAGKRCHICIICTLLKYAPYNIQFTVKVNPLLYLLRSFNKSLHNTWHTFDRSASKYVCLHRNFSPSKKIHSFFFDDYFEYLLCLISL